ncbi:MAG: hypothetical protein GX814_04755, partial [Microbacteriaceae bacterium]|nr:hypothetical protein [Microbacteriaceae bacterium]
MSVHVVGHAGERARRAMRRVVAGVAALMIGFVTLLVGGATAAHAAPADAVTVTVVKPDGTPVQPGEVFAEGATLHLRVQYQKQAAPNDLTGETVPVAMTADGT